MTEEFEWTISKVTGQVEWLQKREATQRFTASFLFLSKPIPRFIINIPLSMLLGDDSERSCHYKGKDSGDSHRRAEANFSSFKKESKMRQVNVDWRLHLWNKMIWGHTLSTHRFDCWLLDWLRNGFMYKFINHFEVKTDHITTRIYVIGTISQITLLASESVHLSWNW